MASRQGGPGSDLASRPGSTERRTDASTALPDRSHRRGRAGTARPTARDTTEQSVSTRPAARTPEDPPLRDPSLYALTDHFHTRLRQPGRYVSTRTVSDAIRHGQLRWNRTDGWRFALVEAGIRFVVVVADTGTSSPVVVTAWTEVADRPTALEAGRFDRVDIDTIAVRAALSESSPSPIPDQIRPRAVSRPFVVGGHRLTTDPGDPAVTCVECDQQFRSKASITGRRCQGGPRGG